MFVATQDSLGHVEHYVLDVGASLGAAAKGGKKPWNGFENTHDLKWTMRRLFSFGFVAEPWRRADQASGIPSAGNIESTVYSPENFRTLVPQAAFRERTDRDAYWGAKIVASFSDAQIAAAVRGSLRERGRVRVWLCPGRGCGKLRGAGGRRQWSRRHSRWRRQRLGVQRWRIRRRSRNGSELRCELRRGLRRQI
jgi:hypothetical protein